MPLPSLIPDFLVLPVSLVKYPLSYLVRDPLPTTLFLSLFLSLSSAGDPMTMEGMMNEEVPVSEWIASFLLAASETVVFARLLLKPLLADRNEILADSILAQCKLYATGSRANKPAALR
jgi:hypothetical protein